ncbi:MAG: DUF3365 domain-containing protein [Dinoroseobacter sp.]|nr:DUF3365 domain-containing protein [Dinoroseobacter sp.]
MRLILASCFALLLTFSPDYAISDTKFEEIQASAPSPLEISTAIVLADFLQSSQSVVSELQEAINSPYSPKPTITGNRVAENALIRTGYQKKILEQERYQILKSLYQAVISVIDFNKPTIEKKDIGFKGFVPATFGRLVAEEFSRAEGQRAKIKITAPKHLVRNLRAMPDKYEELAIETIIASEQTNKPFVGTVISQGTISVRVIVPVLYDQGCLMCHGLPKGAPDITGHPKEGSDLGELGGAISITLFRNKQPRIIND